MFRFTTPRGVLPLALLVLLATVILPGSGEAQRTQKPALHGKHWMAITGKPSLSWPPTM